MEVKKDFDPEIVFEQALALPPEERSAFVRNVCESETEVAREILSLLDLYEEACTFFDDPALAELPAVLLQCVPARPVRDDSLIGRAFGHYRLIERIGSGGMGVVYKAEDTRLRRFVAVKLLPPDTAHDESARARFEHEARAASSLDHPNICAIHDIGETDDGRSFLVMPYYEGSTLKQRIDEGGLPVREAVDYALQAACGLKQAHENGIVHRDIKPGNLLVTRDGHLKILDFGLARLADQTLLTRAGMRMGTPAYMSPEQARGLPVDHRTDIWSLGVVLYEMITGERPFRSSDSQALIYAILHEKPASPLKIRPELPAALGPVVLKCLDKEPGRRYASAADLIRDLEAIRANASPAIRLFTGRAGMRLPHWAGITAAMLSAVFLLVGALIFMRDTRVYASWTDGWAGSDKLVAVLPFRTIGEDAAVRMLSQGLQETLTSRLTQFRNYTEAALVVVPTGDVQTYEVENPGEARAILNANLVFEGSIQPQPGNGLRIILNLIDTGTGEVVESQVIDYRSGETAALQDEVTYRAVDMLRLEAPGVLKDDPARDRAIAPGANDLYLKGRGYLRDFNDENNVEDAVSLFQQALRIDSSFAPAWAALGEAYWRWYRLTRDSLHKAEALRYAGRAAEMDERSALTWTTLGLVRRGTGDYAGAVEAFQRALLIEPRNAQAYAGLGKSYQFNQQYPEAERAFQRAIALEPSYWNGYNNLGDAYADQGRYAEAIEQYTHVTRLVPRNPWGYVNLGYAYFFQEKWARSAEAFERALALRRDYDVLSNMGTAYFYDGKFSLAAQAYEEALRIQPASYQVWGNLGEALYWAPGRRSDALAPLRRAAEMAEAEIRENPTRAAPYAYLSGYYARLGRRADALAMLEETTGRNPEAVDVFVVVGDTYAILNLRDEALNWIEQALESGYPASLIERNPLYRSWKTDRRFSALLTRYRKQPV